MTRALGLFGFTGGFLAISPAMRQTLMDVATASFSVVRQYSPYSYAGLVLAAFGGITMVLVSGSSAR